MDEQHAIIALQSLVALAGFLVVWNLLWPRYIVDNARQRLFAVRDLLFLVAMRKEAGLTFESPAYQTTRRGINSLINAISHFNVWMLLAMATTDLVRGKLKSSAAPMIFGGGMTVEQKMALAPTEKQIAIELAKYLFLRTPVSSLLITTISIFGGLCYLIYRVVLRICKQRGLFDVNLYSLVRARIEHSMTKEMRVIVCRANYIDTKASWRGKAAPYAPPFTRHHSNEAIHRSFN